MAKRQEEDDFEVVAASVTKKEVTWVEKSGKKKKQEVTAKEGNGNYGPDYERRKAELNREANSRVRESFSHEVFKKTKDEKEQLKAMKLLHKNAIKRQGLDPKKVMNPSGNLF